ncbi:MAG: glycosyltransferase family 2 protein [Acidimicrobiia bacterium]
MRACIVDITATDRPESLDQVASYLRDRGWSVDEVEVGPANLSGPGGARDRVAAAFAHTPRPLMDSWVFAGLIRQQLTGCDVVVLSDRGGLGGIFALEMANQRSETAQQVWTVAGSSEMLRLLRTGGSLATTDDELESVLDWEIAQYVASDQVICRSAIERQLLDGIGVDAVPVPIHKGRVEPVSGPSRRVFVPGPVSRLDSSPEILRAISDVPDVSVVFGVDDRSDEYWKGTTWEAIAVLREMLGDRVTRLSEAPQEVDLVVIGDPLTGHESTMHRAADTSTPVAAPTGSVVAQQWVGVAEWDSEDDLAEIIRGTDPGSSPAVFPELRFPETASPRSDRARRISVGIPVFGECTFLGELIASVLAQSTPVHEVLILADGPPSQLLVDELDRWTEAFEGRLKYAEQPNRGVCVARNRIFDLMSGDAVLLVDQDDLLAEHALERMSSALRSNPEHAAVACWTEFFGDYNGIEAKPPFDRRVGTRENPIVSTAVLLDRAVVDDGVRFEPDLAFLYCEDWNFWAEMVSRGHTLGLVPEPLVRHRVHTSSGGFKRTDLALEVGRDRARRKLRTETGSPSDGSLDGSLPDDADEVEYCVDPKVMDRRDVT